MSFTGFDSSSEEKKKAEYRCRGQCRKELTRKDEPSVSLENFALVADDVIVWYYNE